MNQFEASICTGVRNAHRTYKGVTGNWLFHAPEHFIQNMVFLQIGKTHEVYAEASRKKITAWMVRPPRGRPPERLIRYDLVVWYKTTWTLRAVIEIKRSQSLTKSLRKDADRVRAASPLAEAGYVLVYSEARGSSGDKIPKMEKRLIERFTRWEEELEMALLNRQEMILDREDGWVCGFALYRA